MDRLAVPSFQEGSGSPASAEFVNTPIAIKSNTNTAILRQTQRYFISSSFLNRLDTQFSKIKDFVPQPKIALLFLIYQR
jgi:hypothetical protein